jgi:hypothetical protein
VGGNHVCSFHVVEEGVDELGVVDADGNLFEYIVECNVCGFEAAQYV